MTPISKTHIISGIQQIGIGVKNTTESFDWYRKVFGTDILLFDDVAEARLMQRYTGDLIEKRHAILALNLNGGAGLEIWQFKNRIPNSPSVAIQLGDTGIFSVKIKSTDVATSLKILRSQQVEILSNIMKAPGGLEHFFIRDPFGNIFEIVENHESFAKTGFHLGGVMGCTLGVKNMEVAKKFYLQILGYDHVIYDQENVFQDLHDIPGGKNTMRRVLLTHSAVREGNFSKLLGSSQIELIHVLDRASRKIFANRFWGDLGFIHLCFDVSGMDALKEMCALHGHSFTADSQESFDMGESAGRFSYLEDPDETLIELIETHQIPIIKKIGWFLNLRNRNPATPLPNWILKALRFNRVK